MFCIEVFEEIAMVSGSMVRHLSEFAVLTWASRQYLRRAMPKRTYEEELDSFKANAAFRTK